MLFSESAMLLTSLPAFCAKADHPAESLFVHRNTLLYRMDRIQELTGLQLDQANMRLALHLALRLWQLRPENEPDAGQL